VFKEGASENSSDLEISADAAATTVYRYSTLRVAPALPPRATSADAAAQYLIAVAGAWTNHSQEFGASALPPPSLLRPTLHNPGPPTRTSERSALLCATQVGVVTQIFPNHTPSSLRPFFRAHCGGCKSGAPCDGERARVYLVGKCGKLADSFTYINSLHRKQRASSHGETGWRWGENYSRVIIRILQLTS